MVESTLISRPPNRKLHGSKVALNAPLLPILIFSSMVSLTKWDRNVKQKSRAMVRQKSTSILLFDGIEVLFERLNNGVEACGILNPTRSGHSAFCTLSAMSKKAIVPKIVFTPRFGAVVQVRKNGRKFRCGALIDNAIDIRQRFSIICE